MNLNTELYSKYIKNTYRVELYSCIVKEIRVKDLKMSKWWRVKKLQITFGKEMCNRIQPGIENEIPNRVI